MPDFLNLQQQQDKPTSTDIFGVKSPISLAGQPALPQGGPAAAGTSAAPPTVAGTGVAAPAPTGPGPQNFADLSGGAMPETGGDGGPGPGEGSPTGANTDAAGGPSNIGVSFGFGPGQLSIGPTGTISVGARGDSPATSVISNAITQALTMAGVPTSVNVPSLVATLTQAPALGIAAQIAGAAGAPITLVSLAHMFASMSPTSVTSLQAALADPNPETQLSLAQAIALANGGAKGPTYGGVQNIGNLPFDNPVHNVNASTQAAPTTPALNFADMTLTPTFADLANTLGFGRSDTPEAGAPAAGPAGPGPGAGTATGDSSTGGDPGGSPY
jgi:hypothetical protein